MNRILVLTFVAFALAISSGCKSSHKHDTQDGDMHGMQMGANSAADATDLHNTVCPVSGDQVGSSKLTEVYNGKVYHFCCEDCPAKFKANPDKYSKAVAANPAKYGVK